MKKSIFIFIYLAIFTMIIIGCQSGDVQPEIKEINDSGVAPASNEIIESHGSIENIERLDSFVQNVQNQKEDKIQITRHTIEGDPIYHKLNFKGEKIEFEIDSSKDQFGSGEILYYECKTIKKEDTNPETKYILEGCPAPEVRDLLTISHNVQREDYFEFSLKFGDNKNNQINTKDQKLELYLGDGQKAVAGNVQFSTEEMNDFYKLMLFANYLAEKKLTNKCKEESAEKFELTVWINSAERNFDWASCDTSKDGKVMTKLVEDIVKVTKNSEAYHSLQNKK
jgi:hypothetical protein